MTGWLIFSVSSNEIEERGGYQAKLIESSSLSIGEQTEAEKSLSQIWILGKIIPIVVLEEVPRAKRTDTSPEIAIRK